MYALPKKIIDPMIKRNLFNFLLLLLAWIAGSAQAEVTPVWSTEIAVPGEKVMLYLVENIGGQDQFLISNMPSATNASIKLQQPQAGANPLDPNRGEVEVYPILVTPDRAGRVTIGDISLRYQSGKEAKIAVPPLPVLPTSDIKWYNTPVPYGALWYINPQEGYVHQPLKASVKLFLPGDCLAPFPPRVQSVNVKASNFHAPLQGITAMLHQQYMPTPIAYAKGQNWRSADYTGELTPHREGNADVASHIALVQQRGLFNAAQEEVPLPTLSLGALPLPPGAPDNFADTVGQYAISAKTDATSLAMNEAVDVEITVLGNGSLETLPPPAPEDAASWRLIPATRTPVLDANGNTIGMKFSQLMRPIQEVSAVPSFHFSYFDPSTQEYRQAASKPIPLSWKKTDATSAPQSGTAPVEPPPAGSIPVAEMTDIYGIVNPASQREIALPRSLWLLLYLPALAVFTAVAVRRVRARIAAGAAGRAREKELAALLKAPDGLTFLKKTGSFIEKHIPPSHMTPDLRQTLAQRDEEAFRPGAQADISPTERARILKNIRKALIRLGATSLLLLALLSPTSRGAEEASVQSLYEGGQYSQALELLQKETQNWATASAADEYNAGNCWYRLNAPGKAALAYARALQLHPGFKEARANLQFIQRKEGAILPTRSDTDDLFTLLSCSQLWLATVVSTAVLALCIALIIARKGEKKPWLQTSTGIALGFSLLCGINWIYYGTRETPDFSTLPPRDIAYATQTVAARTAASEASSPVITIPASTPVRLLAKRPSWQYIETTTGTRGWVPEGSISPLSRTGTPGLPLSYTLRF